jgi:cellulose synthase operon protein C
MLVSVHKLRLSALHMALLGALALAGCGAKSPQALIEEGKASVAAKDYKAAVVVFKSALEAQPDSLEARLLLGESLLGNSEYAGAAVELNKALEQGADANKVVPLIASALLRSGDFKRLTQAHTNTKLSDPEAQATLMIGLASAWIALSEPAKAEALLEGAGRVAPDSPAVMLLAARRLSAQKKHDEALAKVDKLLASRPTVAEAWALKGDLLTIGKLDVQGSEAAYRKAIEVDKTYAGAYLSLVNMHLRANNLAKAKADADAQKAALPRHPLTFFVEAEMAFASGETEKARELIQQLMRSAPNNVGVLQLAGAAAADAHELVQAETYFSKAIQLVPTLTTARIGLAKVYLRLAQPVKALETLRPVLVDNPDDADALATTGDAQLALGDVSAAEAAYTRAAKSSPDNTRVKTALAMTHMSRGNADAAFAELDALAASSSNIIAEQAMFSQRLRRREYDAALDAVDKIAKKAPKSLLPYEMRGQVHLARRDYAKARQAFEDQYKADPKSFAATANLAALDMLERKPEAARKRLQQAVKDDSKNPYALIALARVQPEGEAALDEVKKLLGQAIQVSPQLAEPRLRLISLLLSKRLYKEALVAAQEAAAAMPNDAVVMDAVGRAQTEAGDIEQAISTFRKMAGASTNSGVPYTRLADIYKVTGRRDLAESSLRKALEVEPDLASAQSALIDMLVSANRKSDALDYIARMQRESPKSAMGYNLEAVFHLRNKAVEPALAAYRKGLANTQSTLLAMNLHRLLNNSGQVAEADRFSAAWAKDHPLDHSFAYQMAEAAIARKQYELAETRLRRLNSLNPDNVLVLNNLASVMILQGKPGAIPLAQKASDLASTSGTVLDTLASAYLAEKQTDQALATQKRAVELDPQAGRLRLRLAEIAIQAGDKNLAKTELARLKELGAQFNQQQDVDRLLKTL